ncbi:MAG: hypothetical protein IJK48_03655 [Bacteroidales bacterium]|nr:hypothetical protein [Bacteroidales bacterium]
MPRPNQGAAPIPCPGRFTPENPEQRVTSLCTLRPGTVCRLGTPSKEGHLPAPTDQGSALMARAWLHIIINP